MTRITVKTATAEDEPRAIQTVMLAFAADPMARWCWPDAERYVREMPGFIRAFAGNGFSRNGAFVTDGHYGAALWLPPGTESDEAAMGEILERTIDPGMQDNVGAVMEAMGSYHPEGPHWYLPLIGVDPAHQGRGLGDALMAHALQQADRAGVPAYLESSNPRNIPLYRRHGFESLGTIQMGSSPPIVPMLRQPR